MPFYDFTREPAREFSLKELVARIADLERRRQAEDRDASADDGNPWRGRRADRDEPVREGEADRLTE